MQNRLQAMLTLCGMSIGVAMVVIVSGLGLGARQQIESQIESAGPTLITIRSGNFRPASITMAGQQDSSGGEVAEGSLGGAELGLDPSDGESSIAMEARKRIQAPRQTRVRAPALPLGPGELQMLNKDITDVRAVAASVIGNLTLDSHPQNPVRIVRLYGFQAAWPDMQGWELIQGRLISAGEHQRAAPVMQISAAVAERLWPGESAIGKTLYLGGFEIEVVGIIGSVEDEGNITVVPSVYLPLSLAKSLLKRDNFDEINVRSASVGKTTEVATNIRAALRELRLLPDDTLDDFRVDTQSLSAMPSMGMDPRLARAVHSNIVEFEQASWEEMAMSLRQAGRTFTYLLSGAAAVSLLVGGIGVMNIMLVSVTARTREIGLRMALGARMKDVLVQFMVEAITLAALGGISGLILGAAGLFIAQYGLHWTTAISPTMLIVAIVMAAATGIIFGYGPARRAASLDPVVALKSE